MHPLVEQWFDCWNKVEVDEMTACEWHQIEGDKITEIRSFYNVGDAVING